MGVLRALRGFFTCVRPQSGPARGEDGGRVAGSVPVAIATFAAVVTSLLDRLQDAKSGRAETYRELESVLWGDESRLQSSVVDRVIAVACEDLRVSQGATAAVRTAASDVLVALAGSHLHDVVSALQGRLKAMEEMSEEFILITLRNLAARYALQCVPFAETTLSALRGVLSMDKQAVLRAMGAMMGVLLHAEEHREHVWEQLLWLLHQYRDVWDPLGVTTTLGYFLGAVAGVQTHVPRAKLLAVNAAVHQQTLVTNAKRDFFPTAQICPEEMIVFLYCKLRNGSKADRVAAVEMLQALVRSDAPDTREKLPLFAKLAQSVCRDTTAQVRREVLHFIGELLHSSAPGCSAWDVVGHIFSEFSQASGRLATGKLCAVEAREERAIQCLCVHVLGTLDISAGAVAKVVAAVAPHAGGGRGAAALQLLQVLPGTIHGAVGASWAAEIPLLLQHLAGTTASSLDAAEWESLLLKFLRMSLEVIKSEAWTVGLSRELSRQLGSSPHLSWEKRFLYKALGTALAACGCLRHVRKQTLKHLKAANFLELWEAQGMVSVVSRCAESHFQLALSSVKEFTGTLKHQKSDTVRTRATRTALMVTYGQMALRAPREQLLAHVERDMVGNVLQLYREGCQEVIQEEPQESPVHPRALVAMKQLSKLQPHLSREENCSLLAQCCQGVVCLRRPEQTDVRGEMAAAAPRTLGVQAPSLRALGQFMAALLRAELVSICLKDMVQVLRRWLASTHACEWERALQVCVQLLGAYEDGREHRRDRACEQFGSLAGLLGPLTCDVSAVSRQRAATCLGHLLQIGAPAETTDVVPWTNEIGHLHERLGTVTSESLLATSANIAKLVCKYFPRGQATDFVSTVVESLLCARRVCAWAAGRWTLTFLGECGEQIFQEEVPELVRILYTCLQSTRQSTRRRFVLRAMFLLVRSHQQPVLNSLLQKQLPTDSDTVEVWRSLGRSALGRQILERLAKKLRAAGKSSHGSDCCTQELGSSQAALEPRTITRALSEVVSVLRSKRLVQHLLPCLLPGLLGQVSETLGEEMALSLGELGSDDTPGSVLLRAELVPQRLVQSLFPWLDSRSANLRLTSTAFFAELMKDKVVEERKLLKPLLKALAARSRDPVSTVQQMAMRGVGNMASGAPAKEEEVLRCSAFALYSALASSASGRRSLFSREVQEAFPSLVLHLRDPAPAVSNAQDCPTLLERLFSMAQSCCTGSYQASQAAAVIVLVPLDGAALTVGREKDAFDRVQPKKRQPRDPSKELLT
ncbi:maestro heat-like repeat-containing protein family member 2B [Apteryx mantelli]|uniref:Maestro heat-like repeat-containing protein family member 2B n=1 Tax=Apteryx mantelli TaxID=2696672 RepID=A0ABM4G764_9AVES